MRTEQPQQSEFAKLPLWRKIEIVEWWARLPALTLLVFLRSGLGMRLLNPFWLAGVTLFIMVVVSLTGENRRPDDLLIFALAALTLGLYQRFNGWQKLRRGVQQHSYYIGTSFLERLPLPGYFRQNRRISRHLEPLLCGLVGLLLSPYTPALGWWIIFAAICLRAVEHSVFRVELRRQLDTLDGLIDSEVQGETVEHFSSPSDRQQAEAAQGVATGLAADIHARIKARTSQPPD
jgi:hypothetical protein